MICKGTTDHYLIGLFEELYSNHISFTPIPKLIMDNAGNTFSSAKTEEQEEVINHDIQHGIEGFDEPEPMTRSASSADCFDLQSSSIDDYEDYSYVDYSYKGRDPHLNGEGYV